jgi:hypothetical protein
MLKLSGLILDVYDDQRGQVMRELFQARDAVPDFIKQAHALQPDEREALPDDVFALILQDQDVTLRKYACIDAGNTELAVRYFLSTGHKLPVEAQKVAAANLITACSWYGLTPPDELTKVAFGLGTALTVATLPSTIKGTKDQISRNMQVARASGSVVNPASAGV